MIYKAPKSIKNQGVSGITSCRSAQIHTDGPMDVTFGGNFLRSNVVCDSITNSLGLYTGNWNNNYNSGSDSGSSSGSGRGKAPAEAAGAAAATTTNVSNNECICKVQDKRSSDALRRRTGVESFQFPRRCLNRAGRQ